MKWRLLCKMFGFFSCVVSLLIGFSTLIAVIYQEPFAFRLGLSSLIPLLGGLGLMQFGWEEDVEELSHREATFMIALSWPMAILWGAFPYFLTKTFGDYSALSFLNSFFESASGFTATAATVLLPALQLEDLPRGLLFWRALSQWLGGLGIILIALLFLPFIRSGGMELFQTGSIARERLRSRVGEKSRVVVYIYLGMTVLACVVFKLCGMGLFDSLCHAFSTVSSGGFSTHTGNIGSFGNHWLEKILVVLMILSSTNFALHVSLFRGEWGAYFRSAELRFYLGTLLAGAVLIYWNLDANGMNAPWREVVFSTVSTGSTTGFWTSNVSLWPSFSRAILLLLMFTGGMVGSTSGAIKCFRIFILFKYAYRQVFRIIHPAGFTPVKIEGKVVEREVLEGLAAFFFLYITIFGVGSLILQGCGYEMVVAASGAAAALGGVGPGFNILGAAGGYFGVPVVGKIALICMMVLGRVEIFPILVVASREFWRK